VYIGKQKRLALIFFHAANKLPAHERMHLAVLVDRTVNFNKKVTLTQCLYVEVKIIIWGVSDHEIETP
jgi:hypothetical protein